MTVVPAVLDTLTSADPEASRHVRIGRLVPGAAADLAVVGVPAGLTALIAGGSVIRWDGEDLVAPTGGAPAADRRTTTPPADRVGVWIDTTGYLHQELRPDGRYDETRGGRPHAYQGWYWIQGDRIDYLDDTGFWAYGEFTGDQLHHAGYHMRRSD